MKITPAPTGNVHPTKGDRPTEDGTYAVRQWYAWRILRWHKGEWYYDGLSAKWPVNKDTGATGIEAYIGPLALISLDHSVPPKKHVAETAEEAEEWEAQFADAPTPAGMEFDL